MKIETCQFVRSSDLFEGCPNAKIEFIEAAPEFTWGNNNRSLVSGDSIIFVLESVDPSEEVKAVLGRLESLPGEVYIDLEN